MRILGIDYGDARIGLALSDASATLCGRAWTLTEWNLDRAVAAIADVVRTEGVERIVLGLPKNMDGTEGPRAEKNGRKEKKHRQTVDAVAASLILEGYLGTLH